MSYSTDSPEIANQISSCAPALYKSRNTIPSQSVVARRGQCKPISSSHLQSENVTSGMDLDILLSWNQWIRKFLPHNCILWRWKIINFPTPSSFLLPLSKVRKSLDSVWKKNPSHHNLVPEKVFVDQSIAWSSQGHCLTTSHHPVQKQSSYLIFVFKDSFTKMNESIMEVELDMLPKEWTTEKWN